MDPPFHVSWILFNSGPLTTGRTVIDLTIVIGYRNHAVGMDVSVIGGRKVDARIVMSIAIAGSVVNFCYLIST